MYAAHSANPNSVARPAAAAREHTPLHRPHFRHNISWVDSLGLTVRLGGLALTLALTLTLRPDPSPDTDPRPSPNPDTDPHPSPSPDTDPRPSRRPNQTSLEG